MTDLKEIIEDHCTVLGWTYSYGNKSNQNLLSSNLASSEIYLLLDPIRRRKNFSEYGGLIDIDFSGNLMLLVKSDLDKEYDDKYESYIKPLITSSIEQLEDAINCSDYTIVSWELLDNINDLDANMDGLLVTYTIKKV